MLLLSQMEKESWVWVIWVLMGWVSQLGNYLFIPFVRGFIRKEHYQSPLMSGQTMKNYCRTPFISDCVKKGILVINMILFWMSSWMRQPIFSLMYLSSLKILQTEMLGGCWRNIEIIIAHLMMIFKELPVWYWVGSYPPCVLLNHLWTSRESCFAVRVQQQ